MLSTTEPAALRDATSSSMSCTAEKDGAAAPPLFSRLGCMSALTRATKSSDCDCAARPTLLRASWLVFGSGWLDREQTQ